MLRRNDWLFWLAKLSKVWHTLKKQTMSLISEKKLKYGMLRRNDRLIGTYYKHIRATSIHSSHEKEEFHHFQRTVFFFLLLFSNLCNPLFPISKLWIELQWSLTFAKQLRMGGRMVLVEEGGGGRVEWHCTVFKTRTLESYEGLDSPVLAIM